MKKLLSIILALAMVLGMASVSAFATDATTLTISSSIQVLKGESVTISVTKEPENATITWGSNADAVATVADGVVTGVSEGTATVTATSGALHPTCAVTVYDKANLALSITPTKDTLKKGDTSESVSATLSYSGSLTDPTAVITYSSSDATKVSVNSTTGALSANAVGSATITATAKIGDDEAKTATCTVNVYDLALSYDVDNYDDITMSLASLKDDIEDEIYTEEGASVTVSAVSLGFKRNQYGTLKDSTGAEITTKRTVTADSITFTASKGYVGEAEYEFTATVGSASYTGSLIFNIKPYEDIDETVEGLFTKNNFYISMPSELDYWKIVTSESDLVGGPFTKNTTGMHDDDDSYLFEPSKHTASNGTVTLYVVGLDGDYVCTGKIEVENLDYDLKYIGEEDVETNFVGEDFEDLYESIFEENNTVDDAYVEFSGVTFTYSSTNRNYKLYNDGTEMTTTKLKTVDDDDIDDVTFMPLKSGDFDISAKLNGKYYRNSSASGTDKDYDIVVRISAVSGDVEYSVVSGSYVYLDEDDFQDFAEDAQTSKALLNYIVIDDSDLNVSKEGYFSLSGSRLVELDGEKLYYSTDKTTQYEISDARFVAAKLATHGSKIYVPFTAYGSKTGAENGKTELGKGYIEITVANNPFTDVATTDYFYDSVLWATAKGITKGTNVAGTLFSPAQGCTRAQVVTFLYRAAGSPSVTTAMKSEVAKFTDVNSTKHKDFIDAIAWAKYYGITSGTSATTFGPDKTCTRAQIVTFIANYVSKVEKKSVTPIYTNQFTDVKPTTTHKSYAAAIQWAVEKGITKGTNAAGTLFSPDATCTRGQVVTFLYNYFK